MCSYLHKLRPQAYAGYVQKESAGRMQHHGHHYSTSGRWRSVNSSHFTTCARYSVGVAVNSNCCGTCRAYWMEHWMQCSMQHAAGFVLFFLNSFEKWSKLLLLRVFLANWQCMAAIYLYMHTYTAIGRAGALAKDHARCLTQFLATARESLLIICLPWLHFPLGSTAKFPLRTDNWLPSLLLLPFAYEQPKDSPFPYRCQCWQQFIKPVCTLTQHTKILHGIANDSIFW